MNIVRRVLFYIGLITVIPILVGLYVMTVTGRERGTIIIITGILILLGIVALVRLSRYLSKIASSLSVLSRGNFNQNVLPVDREGTETQFADSVNQISRHLRESADELERRALLIERSNLELKRMNELKLQFLSSVAHELRTPLINIEKSSFLLLEGDLPAAQKEFIRIINDNSRRLMRLINELLDMSKLEAGKFLLKREAVEVRPLLEEAAASVSRWGQSKNLRFQLEVPEALPAFSADRDRVVQVVINLLSNAIKFTPAGGQVILRANLVCEDASSGGSQIEISVVDTGIGIAQDKIAAVFEKYGSLDSSGGTLPNTGLGLPISRQIVELHGGRMRAESWPGKGSVFSFSIPCAYNDRRADGR